MTFRFLMTTPLVWKTTARLKRKPGFWQNPAGPLLMMLFLCQAASAQAQDSNQAVSALGRLEPLA
jgi:hypothetical protein